MRKGQAFDTFKLMIAAVIAVAILGILLGILGGITTPGADPASAIKEQLSKARQFKGSTFVSTGEASFVAGTVYQGSTFQQSVGGTGTDIYFACDNVYGKSCSTAGGTKPSPLVCDPTATDKVTINNAFQAKIMTCCPSTGSYCCVGIGENSGISC